MKYILKTSVLSLCLLLFAAWESPLFAQDAQRAAATKVGDALNQLPAQNEALFDRLMTDLLSTGSEGVMMLTQMMKAPGETLPQVEYALDGMVQYVTRNGNSDAIATLATDYTKALETTSHVYNKAFFIRELALLGQESSIDAIARNITDSHLTAPVIEAIASIGGPQAEAKLVHWLGLPALKGDATVVAQLLEAFVQLGTPLPERTLIAMLPQANDNLKSQLYYTLGRCGTALSLSVLAQGPQTDYLALLRRLATNPQYTKTTAKAAKKILKSATESQIRCDALDLLLSIEGVQATKYVMTALQDADRAYRQTALDGATRFANASLNAQIIKVLPTLSADTQVDVLTWLGNQQQPGLVATIQPYLANAQAEVAAAAAWSLVRIGGDNVRELLAAEWKKEDATHATLILNCLKAMQGDVVTPALQVYAQAAPCGKAAALALLASRKAQPHENIVLEGLNDANGTVRLAAAKALQGVVNPEHRNLYFNLLENTTDADITPYQQAVVAALASLTPDQQFDVLAAQLRKAAPAKQHVYYAPIAQTKTKQAVELLADRYLAANDLPAYRNLIGQWKATGEQKLIYLRKALETNPSNDQLALLLTAIGRTNTFLATVVAAQYLANPDPEVAYAAAMSLYTNLSRNKAQFSDAHVPGAMQQAADIIGKSGKPDCQYDVQNIRTYLEEKVTVPGFTSLFNGKDLTGWKALVGNPISRSKMKATALNKAQKAADEIAFSQWVVKDGKLIFMGKGDNLCTQKEYGDFEMYVDWLLYPEGPEADAGIYLRGSPQVQIWDTSRVNVGAQVGSGGLYNNQKNASTPTHVADNRLGEWNSFFIRMVGERVTVYLNGDLVVDNVIMENYWDRNQPIFPIGAIELQAHGSKVAYRDIYVRELPRVTPSQLTAQEKAEGFEMLFDGSSLHKWVGNTHDYIPENGVLAVHPTDQGFGDLYTAKEYGDFIFRFEFKLTPGANNGVGIRTPGEGDAAYVGMEIQVLDHFDPIYQPWLKPYQYHGSVYGVIPAKEQHALKPVGEWNEEEIYAKGNYIRVTVNGIVITEGDISCGPIDGREHPGLTNKSGKIGFLGHGSELWYRNVRVKEL